MLTDKQLDIFRGYVETGARVLGLHRWNIRVQWNENREETADASVFLNRKQSVAIVVLTKYRDADDVTTTELRQWAIHECLHILLYDLYYCVENAEYTHDIAMAEADAAEHRIIQMLSKLLESYLETPTSSL